MALTKCPECGNEVSSDALNCPKCAKELRKPKRTVFGKIVKWMFILFNVLMAWWMVSGMSGASQVYQTAGSEAGKAGAAIGTGLAFGMILFIWALGDIVLGLFTMFTRPKK